MMMVTITRIIMRMIIIAKIIMMTTVATIIQMINDHWQMGRSVG